MASTSGMATPAHRITMEDYIRRSRKRRNDETECIEMQKLILDLLRHRRELWHRKSDAVTEDWRVLGVDVYERTGRIVSAPQLKQVFENSKQTLKDMLRNIIQSLRPNHLLVKAFLQNWELYRHFDYYHPELMDFELNLYEELEDEDFMFDEEEEEEAEEEERIALLHQIEKSQKEINRVRPCFKCAECLENFDFEENPPRVMKCGHTFCVECSGKWDGELCRSCDFNSRKEES